MLRWPLDIAAMTFPIHSRTIPKEHVICSLKLDGYLTPPPPKVGVATP